MPIGLFSSFMGGHYISSFHSGFLLVLLVTVDETAPTARASASATLEEGTLGRF